MLTDLQVRVRRIIGQLPESGQFALAGGAALIVVGVVERPTNDRDFFAPYPQHVSGLVDAAQAALEAAGMEVERTAEEPTFAPTAGERGRRHYPGRPRLGLPTQAADAWTLCVNWLVARMVGSAVSG